MAHVQVRRAKEVIPSAMEVEPKVISLLAELLPEGKDLEAATAHPNKAWLYGEIDGPSAPVIASDGTVVDPYKQRAYAISEVAALNSLFSTTRSRSRLYLRSINARCCCWCSVSAASSPGVPGCAQFLRIVISVSP
jgi:hypothetical protein